MLAAIDMQSQRYASYADRLAIEYIDRVERCDVVTEEPIR